MCDKYLISFHKETIIGILNEVDVNKHFSININFLELFENEPSLGNALLKEPEESLKDWDTAIVKVQESLISQCDQKLIIKTHVHCRIYGLPVCPELHRTIFPRNDDANKFLQVTGTVVRMTSVKMLKYQKQFICAKCKSTITVEAMVDKRFIIETPKRCINSADCKSTVFVDGDETDGQFCKDYQEIKMQETVSKLDVGCMPNSMWIILEDDLVETCKPGDSITVCGVVKRRWGAIHPGKKIDIDLVLRTNYIQVNNNNTTPTSVTPELKAMFQGFWKTYADRPLAARDIILKSICPQLFGLHVVKLAVAVVLAGGSQVPSNSGVRVRSEPHLLLVGDPGTGKSQLLRFVSKIVPRSVLTTGVGSTAAGLTVTAIMEGGEWQLEGGALVLADGGICCIDEFNSMKEHDRTSIHEAMEQQTISVAKASIVCKLSTRCSILAATNPKGNIDPSQPLSMNIALASPLLSRFDLILLIRDKVNDVWDELVADYILNFQNNNTSKLVDNIHWTVDTLQAYFAVIKKLQPKLTEDSNRILANYYQAQRRKNSRNKSRTTVRLLDSLVRLSQGHARLMFHQEVETVDAVMAVTLVETAMESDFSLFDLRFDVQSDFPDDPQKHYRDLVKIVLKRLELDDLLEKELESIDQKVPSLDHNETEIKTRKEEKSSGYFQVKNQSVNSEDELEDEKIEFLKPEKDLANLNTGKRIKGNSEITSKKRKAENVEDLALLKLLPSVNDDFALDVLEFDIEGSSSSNFDKTTEQTNQLDKPVMEENPNCGSDGVNIEFGKSENLTNLKKGKQSKEGNEVTLKKRKVNNFGDLASLNLFSSVNDDFDQDVSEFDFKRSSSSSFPKIREQTNQIDNSIVAENPNCASHRINNKEDDNGFNESNKQDKCDDKNPPEILLSQRTKRKNFMNRFRFQPQEVEKEPTESSNKNNHPRISSEKRSQFESQEDIDNLDLEL